MTTLAGEGRSRLDFHYEKVLAKALSTSPPLFALRLPRLVLDTLRSHPLLYTAVCSGPLQRCP